MKRKPKVLLVFDTPHFTPRGHDFKKEFKNPDWTTEKDVYNNLLKSGCDVRLLGICDDVKPLMEEVEESKPDIAFNLTEVFRKKACLDKNIAWLLEMMEINYTGASPSNFLICNNKALTKNILSFHKINVPDFCTFHRGRRIKLSRHLKMPLIVKPLCEEASRGISRASIVGNKDSLAERIRFIHEKMDMDVIVEEYIEGRELYISVIGSKKIKVLPPIEIKFTKVPKNDVRIASYMAKWHRGYRKKWGIKNVFTGRMPKDLSKKIIDTCKRAYRALDIQGYARFDIRVTPEGKVYILEANANPCLARYEDFGQAAEKAGISYKELIQKIVLLGFERSQ